MFFKKKPTIIYLQNESFLVYTKNHPDGVEFIFPEGSVKKSEVVDSNKFSDALNTFVAENAIEVNDYILVLSAETFSQKKLETLSSEEQQKEVDSFIKSSEIKDEFLTKETFELDNNRYVFIADKRFYENILQELASRSWKNITVIPISLFRDISDTKMKKNGLNQKEVQEIVDNEKLIKDANIVPYAITASNPTPITDTPQTPSEQAQPPTSQPTMVVEPMESSTSKPRLALSTNTIIIASVGILLLGGLAFVYTQGTFNKLLSSAAPPKEEVVPTAVPTATPTPVATEEDKSKLTVKILNGTGVVGQAGRVKVRMTSLEYEDIETENSDTKENTETSIIFSPKVSQEYQDEIVEDLEKVFETVTSEVKEDAEADIEILTGTEK